MTIGEQARVALSAKAVGDVRYMELVMRLIQRTGLSPEQIEQNIVRLSLLP